MGGLVRSEGTPAAARRGPTPAATRDEQSKTLSYTRTIYYTAWAGVPGAGAPPAGTVWEHAESETLRRGNEHAQRVRGWALGRDVLARRVVERPLLRRQDGRLAPAGPWQGRTETLAIANLVRLRPAGAGEGRNDSGKERAELTRDVLEVLPGSVRRLLIEAGGEVIAGAYLWRDTTDSPDGREDVRALAIGTRFVIAVRAERRWERRVVGPWALAVWRAERVTPGLPTGTREEVGSGKRGELRG